MLEERTQRPGYDRHPPDPALQQTSRSPSQFGEQGLQLPQSRSCEFLGSTWMFIEHGYTAEEVEGIPKATQVAVVLRLILLRVGIP